MGVVSMLEREDMNRPENMISRARVYTDERG